MSYFLPKLDTKSKKVSLFRNVPFSIGDILGLSFRNKGYSYFFEGIAYLSKKEKLQILKVL